MKWTRNTLYLPNMYGFLWQKEAKSSAIFRTNEKKSLVFPYTPCTYLHTPNTMAKSCVAVLNLEHEEMESTRHKTLPTDLS